MWQDPDSVDIPLFLIAVRAAASDFVRQHFAADLRAVLSEDLLDLRISVMEKQDAAKLMSLIKFLGRFMVAKFLLLLI